MRNENDGDPERHNDALALATLTTFVLGGVTYAFAVVGEISYPLWLLGLTAVWCLIFTVTRAWSSISR